MRNLVVGALAGAMLVLAPGRAEAQPQLPFDPLELGPQDVDPAHEFRFRGCSTYGTCHWLRMIRTAQGVGEGAFDLWTIYAFDLLPVHPTPGWSYFVENYTPSDPTDFGDWNGLNTGDFHPPYPYVYGVGWFESEVSEFRSRAGATPTRITVHLEHMPCVDELCGGERLAYVPLEAVVVTPEPGTLALLGGGLGLLGLVGWRRRRA